MSDKYNFDVKLTTKNFTVEIDTRANYGYFEHDELGDECGGGLWFADGELTDYDGVFALPSEVASILRQHGYRVDADCEPDSPELRSEV